MAGHTHGPTSGRGLWLSLVVTLAFTVGEAISGWAAHSLALVSDAGHNLSDALALGLAAYALWIARRPATAEHTFGYHRATILTALFNAASLVVIALFIGLEAFQRFLHPEPVGDKLMIGVALVAFVMNTVIAMALAGDAKHSLNSRAAFLHMAGDAVSSLAVVAAGLTVHFTHWPYADPLVSLLIAAFIVYSAWGIVTEATGILMEGTPKDVDVDALIAGIKSVGPVCNIHDLHIWTVGDGVRFLSCHVGVPETFSLEECTALTKAINSRLHDDFAIGHATIQTEVEGLCQMTEENALYCSLDRHRAELHRHGTSCQHSHG